MPAASHNLPRHGALADFLDLTDGLSIDKVAEVLRCGLRSVRNYLAGRSPVPWWRIEALRLWRARHPVHASRRLGTERRRHRRAGTARLDQRHRTAFPLQ